MSPKQPSRPTYHQWRIVAAALCGAAAFAISSVMHARLGLAGLVGWNAACITYLLTDQLAHAPGRRGDRPGEGGGGRRAFACDHRPYPDRRRRKPGGDAPGSAKSKAVAAHASHAFPWPVAMSVSTFLLSWLVIQTVFTLRYAHRYFGDFDQDGTINGGVEFTGDQPKDYRDFIYMAVCIGCTSQVSDFNITNAKFRSLVTAHAIVAFSFNVTVLALGINMVASLLAQ